MKNTRYQLQYAELLLAATAGTMRQVENLFVERPPRYGATYESDYQSHIMGCIGEMVVSKYLNVPWTGKGVFKDDDVNGQQVRCTTPGKRLILHPDDRDEQVFWLVRGQEREFTVTGWILAGDGKQDQFWADPTGKNRPAYFVPTRVLHPPHEPTP